MQSKRQLIIHAGLLLLGLGTLPLTPALAADASTLTHVHGLSYSPDGERIMIPSHHGLAVFSGGRWSMAPGPAHDYMGYSATRDALYSSGHAAPGSGRDTPFGLIKSSDGGLSWKNLGLEGESDFHTLGTSYATGAVYVFNHGVNSRMSQSGIHHTRNDGMQWKHAAAKGLVGDLKALAVHPDDADIVAAATLSGLYLSRDAAQTFSRVVGGRQVLTSAFDLDGQSLLFSAYAGKPSLLRFGLAPGAAPQALSLPAMSEDAVAYIAQNPVRRDELAIATFKRSVYLSKDGGRSWSAIAVAGATRASEVK
ncbi:MAG: glycosyl hydrolase [Rhizobacter sp.]|nr:glycosyl hydrolase [Rhizobacter sp.]